METRGFLGLPEQIQEDVLQSLIEEADRTKAAIADAEQEQPVDEDHLIGLKNDIEAIEDLQSRFIAGN